MTEIVAISYGGGYNSRQQTLGTVKKEVKDARSVAIINAGMSNLLTRSLTTRYDYDARTKSDYPYLPTFTLGRDLDYSKLKIPLLGFDLTEKRPKVGVLGYFSLPDWKDPLGENLKKISKKYDAIKKIRNLNHDIDDTEKQPLIYNYDATEKINNFFQEGDGKDYIKELKKTGAKALLLTSPQIELLLFREMTYFSVEDANQGAQGIVIAMRERAEKAPCEIRVVSKSSREQERYRDIENYIYQLQGSGIQKIILVYTPEKTPIKNSTVYDRIYPLNIGDEEIDYNLFWIQEGKNIPPTEIHKNRRVKAQELTELCVEFTVRRLMYEVLRSQTITIKTSKGKTVCDEKDMFHLALKECKEREVLNDVAEALRGIMKEVRSTGKIFEDPFFTVTAYDGLPDDAIKRLGEEVFEPIEECVIGCFKRSMNR